MIDSQEKTLNQGVEEVKLPEEATSDAHLQVIRPK